VPSLPPSYDTVAAARRDLDVDLSDPRVVAFAEQFAADVSVIDDAMRTAFLEATGPAAFSAVQAIYVDDFWPRVSALLGSQPADADAGELWPALEEFMREVARLDALDPVTTELVRLRGARQHDCRVCKSRRSVAAIAGGADEATFDAVDRYAHSDLTDVAKAALALTDAIIWTPYDVPGEALEAARTHLAEDQFVEVVLDVTRNAANKIAVALGADAATVTEGVEMFSTDADGNLTIVGADPR
jgi:alkylhydroperoxidase family enzyme